MIPIERKLKLISFKTTAKILQVVDDVSDVGLFPGTIFFILRLSVAAIFDLPLHVLFRIHLGLVVFIFSLPDTSFPGSWRHDVGFDLRLGMIGVVVEIMY